MSWAKAGQVLVLAVILGGAEALAVGATGPAQQIVLRDGPPSLAEWLASLGALLAGAAGIWVLVRRR